MVSLSRDCMISFCSPAATISRADFWQFGECETKIYNLLEEIFAVRLASIIKRRIPGVAMTEPVVPLENPVVVPKTLTFGKEPPAMARTRLPEAASPP